MILPTTITKAGRVAEWEGTPLPLGPSPCLGSRCGGFDPHAAHGVEDGPLESFRK